MAEGKSLRLILLIITLCVAYLQMVCWLKKIHTNNKYSHALCYFTNCFYAKTIDVEKTARTIVTEVNIKTKKTEMEIRDDSNMRTGMYGDNNGPKQYLLTVIVVTICLVVTTRYVRLIPKLKEIFNSSTIQTMHGPFSNPPMQKKYVICPRFVGRFGNHMFIFSSSYGVAKTKGMKVVIHANCDLLNVFDLKVDIRKDTSICSSPKVKIIKEVRPSVFDKRLIEFKPSDVTLGNYLQSYLYFVKHEHELRKQFSFKEKIRTKAIVLLNSHLRPFELVCKYKIDNITFKGVCLTEKNSEKNTLIGVHVRRGDWAANPSVGYNVATKQYLHKAVDLYKSMYNNLLFVVASNGMNWAKKNMPEDINIIYLEGNSPWIDMAVLTLCEHFISTVGTFSWWAGWLTGGNVIYYKWPAKEGSRVRKDYSKDYSDYFYPHWIGL